MQPKLGRVKGGGEWMPMMPHPHIKHVVLDGPDDDEDEEAAEGNFSQDSFGVPVDALHHVVVHRRVEQVVLRQDQLKSKK